MPAQTNDALEAIPGYRLLKSEIDAAGTGNAKAQVVTDQILQTCLPDIWAMYADKGLRHFRLQYLYASRKVIDFWQKAVWREVDYEEEVRESLGQQSRALDAIRDGATDEIAQLEIELSQSGGYCVGQMATTTSLPPRPGQHDPAAPYYGGDARRTEGRWY